MDVIALLANQNPEKAVFLFDDSPADPIHRKRGTASLRSPVYPGQYVIWSLAPIDVQTPVWISEIDFEAPKYDPHPPGAATIVDQTPAGELGAAALENGLPAFNPVWARHWEGYAPLCITPGSVYAYRLGLQFGGLSGRTISLEGPSLFFPPSPFAGIPPGAVV